MLEPIPFAGMVEIDESFDRTVNHMAGEYVSYDEPVAWINLDRFKDEALYLADCVSETKVDNMGITTPLYTHPVKELTDEEWNKAFDFYCETDEGVLKFDLELRDEWKREQLIRWKEALRKAQQ